MAGIQAGFTYYVQAAAESHLGPDYVECVVSESLLADDPPCTVNTALYLFTSFQYISCCLVFSVARPFRKPIYSNPAFLVSVILLIAYQTYMTLIPDHWSSDLFALVPLP